MQSHLELPWTCMTPDQQREQRLKSKENKNNKKETLKLHAEEQRTRLDKRNAYTVKNVKLLKHLHESREIRLQQQRKSKRQ